MTYFYIQSNKDWNYENKVKYGITSDPYSRLKTDQHSHRSSYKYLFKYSFLENSYKLPFKEIDKIISIISRNSENIQELRNYYKLEFKYLSIINNYLVNDGGGTEFIYSNGIDILLEIIRKEFKIFGIIIQEVNFNEIEKINNSNKCEKINFNNLFKFNGINKNIFELRDYQKEIIEKGTELIKTNNKLYLELATGGGKSYISYSVINNLNPNIIIILTPRINICQQNINDKYIGLLKEPRPRIICKCIQSYEKIYSMIINENLRDILIWFDEAHWGLDNWCIYSNEKKDFLLTDNSHIKYRLFTSASPDKEHIYKYPAIFGNLYSPIKVSKLIQDKWLCDLKVFIYKDKYKTTDVNLINHSLEKFIELNKKLGMSFNNSCELAKNRFLYHYQLWKENKTIIKPYLLINDNSLKKFKEFNKEITNDFFDITNYNGDNKGIAYVVSMYSMGYDNKEIDLLIFNDPKLSIKDIKQSIGRGTRPDGEGKEGKNLNKETAIILPVFINENDNADKYDKIKQVLKYLIIDLELGLNNILLVNKKTNLSLITNNEITNEISEELDELKTIIYEINNKNKQWNIKNLAIQLMMNNIHNLNDYEIYKNNNSYLNLPDKLFTSFKDFDFTYTYRIGENPCYNRKDCIKLIMEYKDEILYQDDIKNNNEKLMYLIEINKRIPNECLWNYYGGDKLDFIIFD
jgi:superfamily II DNA or RNA helicase